MDAAALAVALLGDAIYANPLMMGYAYQKGWLPLSRESLLRAIELNGQQVAANQAAFAWGRRAAQDLAGLNRLVAQGRSRRRSIRKASSNCGVRAPPRRWPS